ncbi:radical SAM/SPASM domain-containing protein [Rhizosphaericola mali]|uniref:Radical SAM protein n=1 Tax=Rhizosphaericola mali TaxID=2545455 RepID=A0A5P2G5G5_9BACT|nr:radical SAM protein [Rhizosphaericola mali]QES91064.1 radical SAM protein [Rhizosphaericola mali]
MKASKFNIFFPYEDNIIAFNSFSSEFIILDPLLYDMYEACFKLQKFDDLKELHNDFFNFLVSKEFLVNQDLDEVGRVKEYSYNIDNDESTYELHINPTMNCNFKCWYCYETHIKDSKMSSDTISHVINHVQNIYRERKKLKHLNIGWFGGEPLLYYKKVVLPILETIHSLSLEKEIIFTSSITTNGLLIDEDVISTSLKYGLQFYQITLDGDRQRHDKVRFISEGRGSYDAIVANIISLAKSKINALVRINCSQETLNGINQIVNDFEHLNDEIKKYISFDFHAVWQEMEDLSDQLNESRNFFKQHGLNVQSSVINTVQNSCYGDHRNHATINFNGEVFKCTARDFTTKNSEGLLDETGNINWNEKFEKRLNIKFKNKPCLECAILPMCGGGCTQQAIEHEGIDYCVHDFDEEKKMSLVYNKFIETLVDG